MCHPGAEGYCYVGFHCCLNAMKVEVKFGASYLLLSGNAHQGRGQVEDILAQVGSCRGVNRLDGQFSYMAWPSQIAMVSSRASVPFP